MQITSIHTMGTPTGAKELRAVGRAKAGVARLFSVCGIDHRNLLAERDQMFNFTPPHCESVVKGGNLTIRNAKGGVHLLCMPSFCMYLINKLT